MLYGFFLQMLSSFLAKDENSNKIISTKHLLIYVKPYQALTDSRDSKTLHDCDEYLRAIF